LSPVLPRRETLRLVLRGEPIPCLKAQVGGATTVDGVLAHVHHAATEKPDADGWGTLAIDLAIPAQCTPGVRRFQIDLEAGPSARLAPESRSLFVVLEIPQPILTIIPAPGGETARTYRWRWLSWFQSWWRGQPQWQGRLAFRIETTNLDADYHLKTPWLSAGDGPATASGQPEGLWEIAFALPVPEPGRYPITATLHCDYHHLRVEALGTAIAADRPGQWSLRLGELTVSGPSPWIPLGAAVIGFGLVALDRSRRRRVPGQILDLGTGSSALDGGQGAIRLGRRSHRVALDGHDFKIERRWNSVRIRWIARAGERVAGVDIALVCPAGHTRRLRPRGIWERLAHDDCLQIGSHRYHYLAPIARHCRPVPRAKAPLDHFAAAGGWS
jgi:hypothetical protein